ncbi:MAG: DUF2798 domain-containing protein [Peptococcaceae bacterium]|nr:DUF2798 domain-containing protein [Peptococcaceae bacterium]
MPETKIQKSVFRILMAFVMVWGMEVYNHFLTEEITARSFRMPISELLLLMGIVILLQQLIAGKIARKIAFHIVNQEKRETFIFTVAMQIVTVLLMCPMMSFVAVLMFKSAALGISREEVPAYIAAKVEA